MQLMVNAERPLGELAALVVTVASIVTTIAATKLVNKIKASIYNVMYRNYVDYRTPVWYCGSNIS